MREHLLGSSARSGRPSVVQCAGVPERVLISIREHHSQSQRQQHAKRSRIAEMVATATSERSSFMKKLSEDLSQGSTRVNKHWKQSTIDECEGAALLELTQQAVARMWYAAGLSFNIATFPEVVDAFDAVCTFGAKTGQLVFPMISVPKLRNDRLDQEVLRIQVELEAHKAAAASYGLSLQSDGKDSVSHQHLVNIVTTTPLGCQFREVGKGIVLIAMIVKKMIWTTSRTLLLNRTLIWVLM